METTMDDIKKQLDENLDKCIAYHGHLCMGQVLGVKLAVKGLELSEPKGEKDLIVIVENDRCIADAILTLTGTRLGRRSFKFKDYGRMAATFWNVATNKAYRLHTAFKGKINPEDKNEIRKILYLPDEKVIAWKEVAVNLKKTEMPGPPQRVVECIKCKERIFDGKDTETPEGPVCNACLAGSYYSHK
jgi:formylmethanofuran dehydrogenase subunit E